MWGGSVVGEGEEQKELGSAGSRKGDIKNQQKAS